MPAGKGAESKAFRATDCWAWMGTGARDNAPQFSDFVGVPYGIRTRVTNVKG